MLFELHLQAKHSDALFTIPNSKLFRRDRKGRKGGGTCVYVIDGLSAELLCNFEVDDVQYTNPDID